MEGQKQGCCAGPNGRCHYLRRESADFEQENEPEVPSSPAQAKKAGAAVKAKKPAPKSSKRQSEEAVAPASKKRKTKSEDSSEELSSSLSEIDSASEPETKPRKTTKPRGSVEKKPATSKKPAKSKPEKDDDLDEGGGKRDSDLSDVIDEEPKPKRKGKARDSQDGKSSKPKSVKSKAPAEEDPDQAEIKRLQGWLVKCGIRKIWGIELKPFETPKAKIKHLKDMLSQAGMTGRYSQEKATEIKEAREMAADIEAIQEGEQRWGKGDEEETKEGERPQRRLVRGAKNYDFLSSDGEETD